MITNAKRTKGKRNTNYGISSLYKAYRLEKKNKNQRAEGQQLFTKILNACNKRISKRILEGDHFKLPVNMGYIGIGKYETFFHTMKWKRLNFQESRKQGYNVFYTDTFVYKWRWSKFGAMFKWKGLFSFKTTRNNSREVVKQRAKGIDYYAITQ